MTFGRPEDAVGHAPEEPVPDAAVSVSPDDDEPRVDPIREVDDGHRWAVGDDVRLDRYTGVCPQFLDLTEDFPCGSLVEFLVRGGDGRDSTAVRPCKRDSGPGGTGRTLASIDCDDDLLEHVPW